MSVGIDFAAGAQCGYIGGEGALHPHRVRECSHQQNRSEKIQMFIAFEDVENKIKNLYVVSTLLWLDPKHNYQDER